MAYSDNFPATRPVFMADFANGGKIDPRATFSRASTANVFDGAKHLSSDNILTYSSTFDNASWVPAGTNGNPSSGQTDPSGGTNGYTIVENTDNNWHRLLKSVSGGSNSYAFVLYAKQNAGTRYLTLSLVAGNSNFEAATFDLAGSSPVLASGSSSAFTSVSATQTASGNGYYKCVLKATGNPVDVRVNVVNTTSPSLSAFGSLQYTGDGTSSIDVAFASLSTTGATDYNATTTQIHREYASSLVSKANNAARFEVGTDGQSAGTSLGCLIESASTNLFTYSSDASNAAWTKTGTTATAEAIGPDGQLSAFAVRETTATSVHILRQAVTIGSGSVAFSIYAKLLGNTRRMVLREDSATGAYATFDLSTGTVAASGAGGSGSIEAVGNGFYRCTMVSSPGAGTKNFSAWVVQSTATTYETYTGDGYSGLLLAMPQIEDQSFASSWISTTSSTATRAADSLSVATADIGYTGGPFTIVSETIDGSGSYPRAWSLANADNTERVVVYRNSGTSTTSTDWYVTASSGGSAYVTSTISSSASAGKLAVSYDTNDVSFCASGGTVGTDGSAVIPSGLATIKIGSNYAGGQQLNGHCKRFAIYNEALTDQNLISLTS